MEFIAQHREGATHTKISSGLKIPRSSLTSLLRDLQGPGYLQLEKETGRYVVGSQVMFLANAYVRNLNVVREGTPFVRRLFLAAKEFTALGIPKEGSIIIVCAESNHSPLAHSLNIGETLPMLASALGKSILAFLDDEELDNFLATHRPVAYTTHTLVKTKDIRDALKKARQSGIAYSHEERTPGVTGIAAPIFNIQARPIASLGIAVPTARLTNKLQRQFESLLLRESAALSRRLGANSTTLPRAKGHTAANVSLSV